jgi:glutamate 5-kinase
VQGSDGASSFSARAGIPRARRVVVKLGTAVLTGDDGGLAVERLRSFVAAIGELRGRGVEVLVVTSGAVGLGAARLGLKRAELSLAQKQACAAVGQGRLMGIYAEAFDGLGAAAAQLLLTEDDFHQRRRYLNLRGTLLELLKNDAVPVINENDSVSSAELETDGAGVGDDESHDVARRANFGDNDKLSALVASKVGADVLLLLTDVDGLYDRDPRQPGAARLDVVPRVTREVMSLAGGVLDGGPGRGGMRTKLEAARVAGLSGCVTVIASGREPRVIERVFSGEPLGTLFLAQGPMSSRRRWIAFATTVDSEIVVNDGARQALVGGKASLLAAGVTGVRGDFARGDVVSVVDARGDEFARGQVNYSSAEVRAVLGQPSSSLDRLGGARNYDAVVTRDNLALLDVTDAGDSTEPVESSEATESHA